MYQNLVVWPLYSGIFLGLIWGRILAPSQFKNEQKLPNFLILHFGENFMKIRTKIAKLQMHENSVPYCHIFSCGCLGGAIGSDDEQFSAACLV